MASDESPAFEKKGFQTFGRDVKETYIQREGVQDVRACSHPHQGPVFDALSSTSLPPPHYDPRIHELYTSPLAHDEKPDISRWE